jgi:phosphoribosylaminoimidazole (AIR) synthetase
LPEGLGARCDLPRWDNGPVQKVLAHLDEDAAIHTFNMGFGWVIIVDEVDADACATALPEAQLLGEITDAGTVDVSIG